jgi:hypothetical protein
MFDSMGFQGTWTPKQHQTELGPGLSLLKRYERLKAAGQI